MNLNLKLLIPEIEVAMIGAPESFMKKHERNLKEEEIQHESIRKIIKEGIRLAKEDFVPYQWENTHSAKTLCAYMIKYNAERRLHYHECFLCNFATYEPADTAFCLKIWNGVKDVSKTICGECLHKSN